MMGDGKAFLIAVLAAMTPGMACGAGPVLKSKPATVQLYAVVQERLSLVASTQQVGFSLASSTMARNDRPISFTTSWNLEQTRSAVVVSAFFEDATGALTEVGRDGAEDRIRPADVWIRGTNGTFAPFTGFVKGTGVEMEVFRQPLRPGVNDVASRTDELDMQIDLRRKKLQSAGAYEGVLTLVVEAY